MRILSFGGDGGFLRDEPYLHRSLDGALVRGAASGVGQSHEVLLGAVPSCRVALLWTTMRAFVRGYLAAGRQLKTTSVYSEGVVRAQKSKSVPRLSQRENIGGPFR